LSPAAFRRLFLVARLLIDIALIPVIVLLSYGLKFKLGWLFQTVFALNFGQIYNHAQIEPYISVLGIVTLIWLIGFYFSGVYRSFYGLMPEIDELVKVVRGASLATLIVMLVIFVFEVIPDSRSVVLISWALGIVLLGGYRLILTRIENRLLRRGMGTRRVVVIGANEVGQDVVERVVHVPFYRLTYLGTIDNDSSPSVHHQIKDQFTLLGKVSDYQEIVKSNNVDVLFLTLTGVNKRWLTECIIFCERNNIELRILSDVTSSFPGSVDVTEFDGMAFLTYSKAVGIHWGRALKRIFDFAVSAILLFFLSPLFLLIALFIKLVSPSGPVFFFQERVTQHNRNFMMIKFRTMIPNAEKNSGPVMVNESGDSRYIKGGDFLRKTSLDELPQLINVLMGDMSLVGPRPERPYFIEQFSKDIPYFDLRHKVKAGITGWAQINGRSVLTRIPHHKVKYDLYYIKHWSFLLDIKILLKTIFVVVARDEAY